MSPRRYIPRRKKGLLKTLHREPRARWESDLVPRFMGNKHYTGVLSEILLAERF